MVIFARLVYNVLFLFYPFRIFRRQGDNRNAFGSIINKKGNYKSFNLQREKKDEEESDNYFFEDAAINSSRCRI